MASLLIAGASGLLGKTLLRQFSSKHKVLGLSKTGRDSTQICELSDAGAVQSVLDAHHPDLVINSAAFSDVDGCERNPELAHQANGIAVKVLSRACKERKIPFIHVSTDYVFNGEKKGLYEVSDPTFPVNIYGLTKLEGEFYAKEYAYQTCVVRTSWLFGAGSEQNFVNAILKRLKTEKVVGVLDDQTDSPTYAVDLAGAIEKIADFLMKLPSDEAFFKTVQFCNKGETTRLEMTRAMKDFLNLKSVSVERTDPLSVKGRIAERPCRVPMSTKAYEDLFHSPIRPWQDALKEYVVSV